MGAYLNSLRKSRRIHGSLELCTVTMDKNSFTFDAKTKTITCEISDLNWHRDLQLHKRVWLDSCDVGFIAVSQRTGHRILFTESEVMKDNEGEIQGWKFVPYKDLEGWTLVIFND